MYETLSSGNVTGGYTVVLPMIFLKNVFIINSIFNKIGFSISL